MSFTKILIANRGEIACRVARTAKALGYRTVAVLSDADANALHAEACDEAVGLGGNLVGETYLDIGKLLAAARAAGADAVHPGYGFLSENAAFAQACADAGLVFIGPPPAAIEAMGNKAAAKRRMIEAGVPCVPGYQGADQRDTVLSAEAKKIGLPVMVKAAAGGGGRGMRLVTVESDLAEAIRTARDEATNAFGSGELILEKAIVNARHVEIQVFADAHGNVVHLGERDCSVQRRHQKVIEEAPSPVVDAALRHRMGTAAVAAARAIGYRGAGTVEFLLGKDGAFYFLEMNTRLQVEHPVTEMITGQDLVAWQLAVAAGEPLPLKQDDIGFSGHAIEVRLYAEDPYNGFLPQTGTVSAWRPASGPGLRVDHGVRDGHAISPYYDPMIAKVIARGATRADACRKLARALEDTVVLGPTTNKHLLVRMLRHPTFVAGDATTAFIGDHFPATALAAPSPSAAHWTLAAALVYETARAQTGPLLGGWRNSNPAVTLIRLRAGNLRQEIEIDRRNDGALAATVGDKTLVLHVGSSRDARVRFAVDGVWRQAHAHAVAEGWLVELDGLSLAFADVTHEAPQGADAAGDGTLRAPMDGRIVAVKVAAGDAVARGQTLVVLEAMKMQHQIRAAADGTIASVVVKEGEQVPARAILATVTIAT
ncbi:MAG TPA: acetyl-CoA carboxylase biotin carboxylase subunit [Vineibacter sp.]|nr:acetyl-CoA carboxylase biotin carboxylase subunit [Vineibacter sp.]